MTITINANTIISNDWTSFKATAITNKNLSVQYEDDGTIYSIFAFDSSIIAYTTIIWKGTVPDSVISGGYSQSQNDSDKSDFETNFKPFANNQIVNTTRSFKRTSYMVEGTTNNSNNKNMVALFNPDLSNKIIKVWSIWFRCKSNTGNNVLAGYEIRRSSTQSGGSNTNIMKFDTSDSASVAQTVDGGSTITVTDSGLIQTWVIQTNTSQTPNSYEMSFGGELSPLILHPNEGIYIKMVTSNNTSAMNIGFAWTEENI